MIKRAREGKGGKKVGKGKIRKIVKFNICRQTSSSQGGCGSLH